MAAPTFSSGNPLGPGPCQWGGAPVTLRLLPLPPSRAYLSVTVPLKVLQSICTLALVHSLVKTPLELSTHSLSTGVP